MALIESTATTALLPTPAAEPATSSGRVMIVPPPTSTVMT